MPVFTPAKTYTAYEEYWRKCRDCYDGSKAVKERGTAYLPMLEGHERFGDPRNMGSDSAYEKYKRRALFFNAMGRTVDGNAGLINQTEPTVKIPSRLEPQLEDITLTGQTLPMFALDVTKEVIKVGRCGVLIDMPTETEDEEAPRPYLRYYKAEDIISWRCERYEGDEELTRVVLREAYEEQDPKDEFVLKTSVQYRVLQLDENGEYKQSIWRSPDVSQEKFSPIPMSEAGDTSAVPVRREEPLRRIPFIVIGPTSLGMKPEKPPLLDLAEVNLSHYRTSADLEHGRHFTALPTPYVVGSVQTPKNGGPLVIGSSVAWQIEKGGSCGMLEFSGAGLTALVTADQEKRKMMAVLGARLLEEQPDTAETATAVSMRHAGDHATLRTICATVSEGLTIAMRWLAWWQGAEEHPSDVDVEVKLNQDFLSAKMSPQELQVLVTALQAESISYATYYARLQAGRIARPGVTAEEEMREIQEARDSAMSSTQQTQAEGEPPSEQTDSAVVVPGNPYNIRRQGSKFLVVKSADGKVMGTFDSLEKAKKQLAALHANERR